LDIRRIAGLKDGERAYGNRVRVKVVKNKVAPPFRRVELEIMFGKGISASASLIDAAVKCGIVDKKGAWYTYGEEKLGQGRENAKSIIEQNKDLADEIEAKVRVIFFPPKTGNMSKPVADATAVAEKKPGGTQTVTAATKTSQKASAAQAAPVTVPKTASAAPAAVEPAMDKSGPRAAKPAADDDGGLF